MGGTAFFYGCGREDSVADAEGENSSTLALDAGTDSAADTATAEVEQKQDAEATGTGVELAKEETGTQSQEDKPVDWEARFKKTQSAFTKQAQEFAALKKERETD